MPLTSQSSVTATTKNRGANRPTFQLPPLPTIDEQLAPILPLLLQEQQQRESAAQTALDMIQGRPAPPQMPVPPSGIGTGGDFGVALSNIGAALLGNPEIGSLAFKSILGREQERNQVQRENVVRQGDFQQQQRRDLEAATVSKANLPAEATAIRREATATIAGKDFDARRNAILQGALAAFENDMAENRIRLEAALRDTDTNPDDVMNGMRLLITGISNQLVAAQVPENQKLRAKGKTPEFPPLQVPVSSDINSPPITVQSKDQLYRYLGTQIGQLPTNEAQQQIWEMVQRYVAPQIDFYDPNAMPQLKRGTPNFMGLPLPRNVEQTDRGQRVIPNSDKRQRSTPAR